MASSDYSCIWVGNPKVPPRRPPKPQEDATLNKAPIPAPRRMKQENQQGSFTIVTKEELRTSLPKNTAATQEVEKKGNEFVTPVDFNVYLLEAENDKVRGVLELSTLHHDVIDKVPARIICLFDISGSMLLKCGRNKKSKFSTLKKMAVDLIDSLEENGDYFGLVTFGEESKTVVPVSLINQSNREEIKRAIESSQQTVSSQTDLSSGLTTAIEMLIEGDDASKYRYRNTIIIFSDGEINSGITDTDKLLHMTREKIRESKPKEELKSGQWLSISCVTTGGNISDTMYLLSKFCGNDAYYYIDSATVNPQVDMLTPVLLRKSAIVQFLTLTVVTKNGAKLNTLECTREHTIKKTSRKKRQPEVDRTKLSYYLHDLPAGSQRHFSVALDMDEYKPQDSEDLLHLELEFVDSEGNIQAIRKEIRFNSILTPRADPAGYERGLMLLAKNDIRFTMQSACRRSANVIAQPDPGNPEFQLEDGKTDIQKLMESYAERAQRPETKIEINKYGEEVIGNLNKLIQTICKSQRGDGHKWTKIKAISSSIARESPNVANLVSGAETLCPLPLVADCATDRMRALAMKVFQEQQTQNEMFKKYGGKLHNAASDIVQSMGKVVEAIGSVRGNNPLKPAATCDEELTIDDDEEDFMKLAKRIALS